MARRLRSRPGFRACWITLPAALLATLFAGCSMVEFGYHQLDWLMLQRIEQWVHLDGPQRQQLEDDIADLIDWHCTTQLPEYSQFLADVKQNFEGGAITAGRVEAHSERLEGYWYALLERSLSGASHLLSSLSDRQIAQLDRLFEQRHDEAVRALRASTDEDPSRGYAKLATRQWKRWLGSLEAEQRQAIDDWSRAFRPLGDLGIDYRSSLLRALRRLVLEHRGDSEGLQTGLLRLLADTRRAPPTAYAARVDANKQLSIAMVADVGAAADATQIQHLSNVVERWRAELAGIACR
jgi:hypothetical protein